MIPLAFLLMVFAQADHSIDDGAVVMVPSRCAYFQVVNASPRQVRLINKCAYAVNWSMQCAMGATRCYGGSTQSVPAGEQRTVGLPLAFVLEGPFRM